MKRRLAALLVAAAAASAFTSAAAAAGGSFTVSGGTPAEQSQIRAALDASSFDWSVLPQTIQVTIEPGVGDYATPGDVYLDPALLDQGEFSWGIVQHEFAHQVDFLLLSDADRARLQQALGGVSWWPDATHQHSDFACERFASTLAWSYWPSPENALRPQSASDEAGAMAPAAFRALLAQVLPGAPTTPAPPPKVHAPKLTRHRVR